MLLSPFLFLSYFVILVFYQQNQKRFKVFLHLLDFLIAFDGGSLWHHLLTKSKEHHPSPELIKSTGLVR